MALAKRDDENEARMAIQLSILEPIIINDENLINGLKEGIIGCIFDLIDIPTIKASNPKEPPIYLKYAMRCITSSLRNESSVDKLFSDKSYF